MSIFNTSNLQRPQTTPTVGQSNDLAAPKVDANSMQAALYGGQAPQQSHQTLMNNANQALQNAGTQQPVVNQQDFRNSLYGGSAPLTANDILNNNAKAAAPVKPLPDPSKPTPLQASEETPDAGTAASNTPSSVNDNTSGAAGTATPTYLADWGSTSFMDAVRNGGRSIGDYASDYEKWARANNKEPLDVYDLMQAVQGKDLNKSYKQNEKDAKKLERQQKWEQIGNVLNHLGNFIGTLAGAPAAKYETGEQLTARQQAVRDAIMKQRADPRNIYAMLLKQRADDRARDLNNANIALRGAQQKRAEGAAANEKAESDAKVGLTNAQQQEAEKRAGLIGAQTDYTRGKNRREQDLQGAKKAVLGSQAHANNASAAASAASADASHARASKTRLESSKLGREAQADTDFEKLYNDPEGRKYIDQYAKNNHMDVDNNSGYKTGGGSWSNKNNRIAAVKWARSKMQGRKSTGVAWKKSTKKISLGMHWKKSK